MVSECQICSSQNLSLVLDMGYHPPSDSFLTESELNEEEVFYPLRIVICENCKLVQLEYAMDPEILFTDKFIYRTGFNKALKRHFKELVESLIERFNLGSGDFVVDIGSNDGTLLSYYPENISVLGVDPSKTAEIAVERGIPTLREFFTETLANDIVKEYGKANVVTCTNTFAHVRDIDTLVKGVKKLLADNGSFIQESHYFMDMVDKIQHDEIYLEHLRYYSLESLVNLFDYFDMEVFKAERISPHGGSIRTFAAEKGVYRVEESVHKIMEEEREYGLNAKSVLKKFRKQANKNRIELINLLSGLRKQGNKIVGVGAAAKGVSLLNFCKIGPELIDYIAETNDLKIGRYTPGTHIPIVDEKEIFNGDPDYALLLAWNLKDILIPKLREKGFKGNFIIPNPRVQVL